MALYGMARCSIPNVVVDHCRGMDNPIVVASCRAMLILFTRYLCMYLPFKA